MIRYIKEGENGKFLFVKLSQYEEYDDIFHIESNDGKRLTFEASYIIKFLD